MDTIGTNDRLYNEINGLKKRIKSLENENNDFKNIIKNLDQDYKTQEIKAIKKLLIIEKKKIK